MNSPYLVSICIPAYKRIGELTLLLDSIAQQTFKNFEVVVTDDSPDDSVADLCRNYPRNFELVYYKNNPVLGTPENWNEGTRKAKGEWVKLMHDDDYFADQYSLQHFVDAIHLHPTAKVFYSAFLFENSQKNTQQVVTCNWFDEYFLSLSPFHLLKRNYFGNPSCLLINRQVSQRYDSRFKYIVDFAYYITLLRNKVNCVYIPKVLIRVGINDAQVTNYTYKNKAVQLYENHTFFNTLGNAVLINIVGFDYYWRLYRNFEIRNIDEIRPYYDGPVHPALHQMIRTQRYIPAKLLRSGFFSKIAMLTCYCRVRLSGLL